MMAGNYTREQANPFNWTGSKFRYLDELLAVLPKQNGLSILDPFVGGGDLISKLNDTWNITASDCMQELILMHTMIQGGSLSLDFVESEYDARKLSKTNKAAFERLKDDYNKNKDPKLLYLLITNSFNNQIRFNKTGQYNMPFGKNRSEFNKSLRSKFINYKANLDRLNINFLCEDFTYFDFDDYDLVILDPPYLNTTATYNEQGGWNACDDKKLHDKIRSTKSKFVYFNQSISKGVANENVLRMCEDYNYITLKDTTKNASYNRKGGETIEVMIYN